MRQKRRPFNVNDTDDNGNGGGVLLKKSGLINLYGIGGKYESKKKNYPKSKGKSLKTF